jgi:hypothetical protein
LGKSGMSRILLFSLFMFNVVLIQTDARIDECIGNISQ